MDRRITNSISSTTINNNLENNSTSLSSSCDNSSNHLNILKTPTLVIAISDFTAFEYDQLDIRKDEFLMVTQWNYKDGWVYGHRKNNENEKGSFPKVFVKVCKDGEEEGMF